MQTNEQKEKKQMAKKMVIDLSGPDGNAYVLLGYGRRLAQRLGLSNWDEIRSDMTSGDYDHLLSVFRKHFGSVVRLQK
jgi:hypothetical protein